MRGPVHGAFSFHFNVSPRNRSVISYRSDDSFKVQSYEKLIKYPSGNALCQHFAEISVLAKQILARN